MLCSADEDIKTVAENKRSCSFSSERELELFSSYSYNNCVLECFIKRVTDMLNCLPWFLPMFNNTQVVACDPWDTAKFIKAMEQMKPVQCPECLSDCEAVKYQLATTSNTFQ